jgi:UDP-glucose 4-epimerase
LESTVNPKGFWKTNVDGSKNVARFVSERKIPILINASSAAVYGNNTDKIIDLTTGVNPKSVYGETKAIAESEMKLSLNPDETNFYNLRFFNIAGYASTYKIDTPDVNIFPQVANALRNHYVFKLNGDDFSTLDGTCIRDFIHVLDVVKAITSCLQNRELSKAFSQKSINICSGVGTSMLEVIRLMEDQAGESLKIEVLPRREEDPKEVIGDPSIFVQLIDNQELRSMREIASSTWHSHLS